MNNQRLFDLVKYARGYLYDEDAISDREYAVLASAEGGAERLESYDRLKARVAELESALAMREIVGETLDMDIAIIANPEGGWTITAPSLPGCVSQGSTPEEAIQNMREAVLLWQEVGGG